MRRRGFGLLEVMFSTAIFIVVVGSLVGVSRLSLRNAALSAHRSQAINLAQDGLETVRQLRDTAWLNRASLPAADQAKDWLVYPDCSGGYLTAGVALETDYEICFDESLTPNQFGLRPAATEFNATTGEDNAYIVLRADNDEPDPGAPLYFRRTVRFESVPETNPAGDCPSAATDFLGLQLLTIDDDGKICTIDGVEPTHFIKAVTTVSWQDFDKDWSVSLETILTNWRSK